MLDKIFKPKTKAWIMSRVVGWFVLQGNFTPEFVLDYSLIHNQASITFNFFLLRKKKKTKKKKRDR